MPKWTQTDINSKAYGQVSFGQDTDQSQVADPWKLDSAGVMSWAAPGTATYDTTLQRTAAGELALNGQPLNPQAGSFATAAGVGATVTGVTVETLLASGITVPASGLAAKQVYRFIAAGTLTTTVDTQTFEFRLRWGGLTGTLIFDFGAQNPNSGATVTGANWQIDFDVVANSATQLGVIAANGLAYFPSAEGVAVTNVANTVAEQFVLSVQPSAAAATVVCETFACMRVS
jgi:hypothetical protein